MIANLVTTPGIELLERTLNFTEQRHQMIVQNIANIDTPGYVQQDVSVKDFQAALAKAIDRQHSEFNVGFEPESTDEVTFFPGSSSVELTPKSVGGPAFHDRGARSADMLMAQLGENGLAHNMAAQLLRGKFDTLRSAISMRA
jgi:flagellar basal-body rod protein FlgB